ncbi:MAG: hypothetical protein K2X47_00690 [Bdellovibrionales bacterium]|nr:hypothetical protein [Bdellovibrionales bacterium]
MKSQPQKMKVPQSVIAPMLALVMLSACGQAKYATHTGQNPETAQDVKNTAPTSGEFNPDGNDAQPIADRKAEICEPFKSTEVVPSPKTGLVGQYRYQDTASGKKAGKEFSSINEIKANGKPGMGTVVLRDLNLTPRKQVDPTRSMDRQLVNARDEVISGQFMMSLKTGLMLDEDEQDGLYHLGFIVNGAVEVGTWNEKEQKYVFLMKSESLEKPGFKCARNFLNMKKGSPLKVLIRYGHLNGGDITIQALWKKVDTEKASADPRCDHTKPLDFYLQKSGGGVTPSPEFTALKKSGWKVLSPANFSRDPAYAGLCVPMASKKP